MIEVGPWDGPHPCAMERPGDPGPFVAIRAEDERSAWFAFRSASTGRIYAQTQIGEWKEPWRSRYLAASGTSAVDKRKADLARLIDLEAKRAAAERLGLAGEAAALQLEITRSGALEGGTTHG